MEEGRFAPSTGNRVGRAYVCAGRHCGNIGGGRNEHACGGGLCTAGIYIDDDWNFGIENCLRDSTHRGHQPARRVQKNNQAYGLVVDRAFNSVFYEILDPGIYRFLDLDYIDMGLLWFGRNDRNKKNRDPKKTESKKICLVFMSSDHLLCK